LTNLVITMGDFDFVTMAYESVKWLCLILIDSMMKRILAIDSSGGYLRESTHSIHSATRLEALRRPLNLSRHDDNLEVRYS
jgi:hypothetical protein